MPVERALARGAAVVAAGLVAAAAAQAQPSAERLAACAACHGASGNSPSPAIPSIAGQPRVFIENQLVIMREGLREVPVMAPVLKGLTDEEISALAKHFSALPVVPAVAPVQAEKQRAGAEISRKALCGTCHLATYSGQNQVPRLAGQHEDYLLLAMKAFRDQPGPGRDTIMAATLRGMNDTELGQLAHYFSQAPIAPAK
jgi:cytochrome c553